MRKKLALLVSAMTLVFAIAAFGQSLGRNHSEADAVKKALEQADLKDVTVADNAGKNTITLGGMVHSEAAKARAGNIAKTAAGNRQIAHEISVEPVGNESHARGVESNLDRGIENDYKAALLSRNLDNLSVHCKAKKWRTHSDRRRQECSTEARGGGAREKCAERTASGEPARSAAVTRNEWDRKTA